MNRELFSSGVVAALMASVVLAYSTRGSVLWSDSGPYTVNNFADVTTSSTVTRDDTSTDTLYFKFHVSPTSDYSRENYFAAFELFEGGAERVGVGNAWFTSAYSVFRKPDVNDAGDLDLNSSTPESLQTWERVRAGVEKTFVFKVHYNAGSNDNVTLWLNPNLSAGQSEVTQLSSLTTLFDANGAFNQIRLRQGGDGPLGGWTYSDLAIAGTFGDFVSAPEPPSDCTLPPSGLIHWWPGNGNSNDVVGTNHATLINGASFGAGRVESGFGFDGAGSYVNFGAGAGNFGLSNFTVDFWIRTTSTRLESVLGKRAVCAHGRFWGILNNAGILIIELDQNSSPYLNLQSNRSINDGLWHHIAVVRQGLTISLFIDGTLDNSSAMSDAADIFNDADLIAGKNPCVDAGSAQFFTGVLDEIDIFNRTLAAAEIQAIYDAGNAGKCIALLKITRSGPHAVLSWTTSAVGFTLQTATNLVAPINWVDSTNVPDVLGIEYAITNALSDGSGFFRLRRP